MLINIKFPKITDINHLLLFCHYMMLVDFVNNVSIFLCWDLVGWDGEHF